MEYLQAFGQMLFGLVVFAAGIGIFMLLRAWVHFLSIGWRRGDKAEAVVLALTLLGLPLAIYLLVRFR